MDPRLSDFLARLAEGEYAAFTGADVRLRLPIREQVINDLLAITIVATHPRIEQLNVSILEDNLLHVGVVSPAVPFAPRLTVELTIDQQVALSPSPTLSLFLVQSGLTRWLSWALPFISSLLPPMVTCIGTTLIIDIRAILQEHGFEAVIPFIRSADFASERGVVWLTLHLAR